MPIGKQLKKEEIKDFFEEHDYQVVSDNFLKSKDKVLLHCPN